MKKWVRSYGRRGNPFVSGYWRESKKKSDYDFKDYQPPQRDTGDSKNPVLGCLVLCAIIFFALKTCN